ncbi:MAG TPA: hypothetical protein VFU15_00700 [Bacteroidia bacterium]|nr:hypothetical protein [Bacteroidia bacterium]
MKKIASFVFLIALFSSCVKIKNETQVSFYGTLEKQGITTYQYGTHTIVNGNTTYALKSETINLDNYAGRNVTITGSKIKGYPIDGGPDYIDVTSVR